MRRLHRNIERLARLKFGTRLRIRNHGRDHVFLGGELAHRDTIARACRDLLAVGDLLALAEVDEIVFISFMKS